MAPDLYFVRGVPNTLRGNFKIWEEGAVPCVVFEFTTKSSKKYDLEEKYDLYRRIGVEEYYLFDPEDHYLTPRFRAFRLEGGRYVEVPAGEEVYSPGMGLDILVRGPVLDFRDPATGRTLPTPDDVGDLAEQLQEFRQRAEEESRRAEEESRRAEDLEARVRALEEEVRRLREER